MGANLGDRGGKPVVNAVHNGSPAELAGIAPGDELVALDGLRISATSAVGRTRRYKKGDKSDVTVFRGDELMTVRMKWDTAPTDTCFLTIDEDAEDSALACRAAWLGR